MLIALTQPLDRARVWLTARLVPPTGGALARRRKLIAALVIFIAALGVRWLHQSEANVEMQQGRSMMITMGASYRGEAARMLSEGGWLLPRQPDEPTDARLIVHPPGYALLIAALEAATGNGERAIITLQIFVDALAAVMVFVIAAELLPAMVALIAGLFAAFSPHLSYYSLWLSPDSLAVLPILVAVFLLIRADKHPRWALIVVAGAMLGLSCWLRANGLLLALLLGAIVLLRFERARRWRYAAAFIITTLAVISPITIRNYLLYHRFVPLSLGAGITMIEGIGDYDRERRFDMPRTDAEVAQVEAQWHNRPDYAVNLWSPDGIERDRERMRRGLAVARSHPAWFAGAMLRRASWMLSYNDSRPRDWPFNTASVPIITAAPSFSHSINVAPNAAPVWSNAPAEWLGTGEVVAPQASVVLAIDQSRWQLTGDGSAYDDQFVSAPLAVKKNSDYVMRLTLGTERETLAAKVTSLDRRLALASAIIPAATREAKKAERRASRDEESAADANVHDSSMSIVEIPFASGSHEQVRVVLSNNGGQAIAEVGAVELYEQGRTAQAWTRWLRPAVRGVQKNVYTTARMLVLIGCGLVLLVFARRRQVLVMLLTVPLYYLVAQSALHTEYRYILAMHDFLFIVAATALYVAGALVAAGLRRALARTSRIVQSYRA
ncbi:MAG: ArnT family glycosyltransferase [Blastocatellia bacterium]